MKKKLLVISCFVFSVLWGLVFGLNHLVYAEDANGTEETTNSAMSISISPVNKVLKLEANSVYEDSFKVTNSGDEPMDFEVYASPYSYTFSETSNEYQLGFSHENNYTQIVRWITFKDKNGEYVKNPKFTAQPKESIVISYRISTPASVPAGGQYAVLFAHTLTADVNSSGLKTEASPGLVVYGRGVGETIATSEISNLQIAKTLGTENDKKNIINATAKVKNTGNVDFMARTKLVVTGLFGTVYYETQDNTNLTSIIPETELTVADQWEETPYFGLFHVTWTVFATDNSQTTSAMILILPTPIIILMILLLTIITVWIIITVRKRKERRSKFIV